MRVLRSLKIAECYFLYFWRLFMAFQQGNTVFLLIRGWWIIKIIIRLSKKPDPIILNTILCLQDYWIRFRWLDHMIGGSPACPNQTSQIPFQMFFILRQTTMILLTVLILFFKLDRLWFTSSKSTERKLGYTDGKIYQQYKTRLINPSALKHLQILSPSCKAGKYHDCSSLFKSTVIFTNLWYVLCRSRKEVKGKDVHIY